jgi:beta-glucanase (GH16 family)
VQSSARSGSATAGSSKAGFAHRRRPPRCKKIVRATLVVLLVLAVVAGAVYAITGSSGSGHATGKKAKPLTATVPAAQLNPGDWSARTVVSPVTATDNRGDRWAPASGFVGGVLSSVVGNVRGTAAPQLYGDVLTGVTKWSQKVPGSGTYAVNLFMTDPTATGAGQRVFSITANGQIIATDIDPYARAGAAKSAAHALFLVPVTGTQLSIEFVPQKGEPIVSAVEATFQHKGLSEQVAWADDFNGSAGSSVDSTHWTHAVGGGGWGNQELEYYTSDTANSHLDGSGHLVIAAIRGDYTGQDGVSTTWTSARVSTEGRYSFMYGTVTARMKLPAGKALWPAFWALGADHSTVGWPASGELDVVESYGNPQAIRGTLISPDSSTRDTQFQCSSSHPVTASGFSDYTALWTPVGIQISVDNQPYCWASPADQVSTTSWVFDKPFYLLLDLAIQGTDGNQPDSSTPSPSQLVVDSVRVSQ